MKAVQVERPGVLQIIEKEKPVLKTPDMVLIQMTAAGICGSDMHIYHGTNAAATYPRIIGHEMVGVVREVGAAVDSLKVGDRVIVNQVVSCGTCYACKKGRGNVCHNLKVRGVHIDGGFSEFIAVSQTDCYRLPDNISDTDAVMIEPTTIAMQACSRAQLTSEDTLLIIGSGALGSTVLKIARLTGATILVADVMPEKLAQAKAQGAHHTIDVSREDLVQRAKELTDGYGPTVTIDAACTKTSFMQAISATGCAGRVIVMGFSVEPVEMNHFLITSKELDVRGSRLQNKRFGDAVRLIEEGKLDLTGTVSHTFPLAQAQKAFDFSASGDPSIRKLVLTFDA